MYKTDCDIVLPRRRILKIVAKDVFNGFRKDVIESEVNSIGTKRKRAIVSGADEMLDDDEEEEDANEEDILTDALSRLHARPESPTSHEYGHH